MGDFRALMRHQLKRNRQPWPSRIVQAEHQDPWDKITPEAIQYKHINHATVLLQHQGIHIITDPVFSIRASPLSFMGPARYREPSLFKEQLANIDVVLISHDHYDHLDIHSLKYFYEHHNSHFLVGLGLKKYLEKFNIGNIIEMDWQQSYSIHGVQFSFLPAKHWSNRFASPYSTLWGSWMLQSESKTIYYAGDSAFDQHFESIKEQYQHIDLALIPIGAYEPRFFMKYVHMNPSDAFKAHQILDPTKSLAIHWGTFRLTDEGMFDPIETLQSILEENDDFRFEYDRDHNKTFLLT